MQITWEQVVAAVSFVGCLIAIIKSIGDARRASRKEIEDAAGEREGVRRDLKNVLKGIDEIKEEQAKQHDENAKMCDRIAEAKALAQKAYDRIEAHERRGPP